MTVFSASGILECPCNSRFGGDPLFYPKAETKNVEHKYGITARGRCKSGTVKPYKKIIRENKYLLPYDMLARL